MSHTFGGISLKRESIKHHDVQLLAPEQRRTGGSKGIAWNFCRGGISTRRGSGVTVSQVQEQAKPQEAKTICPTIWTD